MWFLIYNYDAFNFAPATNCDKDILDSQNIALPNEISFHPTFVTRIIFKLIHNFHLKKFIAFLFNSFIFAGWLITIDHISQWVNRWICYSNRLYYVIKQSIILNLLKCGLFFNLLYCLLDCEISHFSKRKNNKKSW